MFQILTTSLATTSDSDGRFLLKSVTETTGKLLIQADRDTAGTYQRQRLFDLSAIGAGPGQQVSLGSIELDENAPSPGWSNSRTTSRRRAASGTRPCRAGGTFHRVHERRRLVHLDNLPTGQITLTFFRTGYEAQTIGGINLSPGQELALTNTVLVPQSTAAGTTGIISANCSSSPRFRIRRRRK